MDLSVLSEAWPLYMQAMLVTLRIGAIGVAASLLLGWVCAALVHFRVPIARQLVAVYIELSRNTPLLVQLFFLYFGLPKIGLTLTGETCAIIGLTFLGGSYMAEAFRSGLDSVPRIQRESALALGLTRRQVLTRILLPQAVAVAMPALTANIIFLVKETSVVYVVAVPDLMYLAREHMGLQSTTQESLLLLTVCYTIILLPVALGARWLEGRMRRYAAVR
ncbi:amino acid ABC transporter permease [Actinotignum sanguinis]|uniref:Amino acid ABC transporter permease n=2 Tax=Actinomycetaceae TaxID=2049 RepID=A0ABZ0RCN6_9ACTO|nr:MULTISPECIES: amino acid ABC transporter permease [Actinotignum]WPJ89284.1 amino acid ABC transporter permease [Schaalia turicensis]MDE1552830.1 amino acid ABC transporter permease [Actinotignum sanguinis]MDE1565597.1 amino acid ABC transporter permease [Actinotignum sanguinis]MDE1577367.1 amino acid ABC transporter permease [Actinotignum sanguinis]MDE1642923.1 amino acid ABC transporter permease [Actinotignum sanguinis]